jgi:hypothetical protein
VLIGMKQCSQERTLSAPEIQHTLYTREIIGEDNSFAVCDDKKVMAGDAQATSRGHRYATLAVPRLGRRETIDNS